MWPRITCGRVWQGRNPNPDCQQSRFRSFAPNVNPRNGLTKQTSETKKTIIITFRVSAAEHAVLQDAANRAKLSPSAYIRHAALSIPIRVRSFLTLSPGDVAQLKRLGNLLNQVARASWRGRFGHTTEIALREVLSELRTLLVAVPRPTDPA